MRRSQRGVTFIGWLMLLVPVAIVGYAFIRLVPIYLNYQRVAKAITALGAEFEGAGPGGGATSVARMREELEKRFDVEGIEHPAPKDIDIHREGEHWVAIVDYEDLAPMFGNVSLLVQFHKQVDMQ
ncbi:MAG: DUF4845 domain-containing protein [Steroidobacteraceae bacterium]